MLREIDPNSKNPLFCVEKVKSDLLLFITSKSVLLYGENFEEHLNVSYSNMRQVVEYKNRLILDLDNNIRYVIIYILVLYGPEINLGQGLMREFHAGSRMLTRKTVAHHLFSAKKKEKFYKRLFYLTSGPTSGPTSGFNNK